jgi:quercetin dioxygenase-like cupin family protein
MPEYTRLDLSPSPAAIPPDGILSRTLFDSPGLRLVSFSFAAGQELSEHTAAVPAVIHILSGEADLVLAGDHVEAGPGTWVHMPARLPHSVRARTPLVMVLLLLKAE